MTMTPEQSEKLARHLAICDNLLTGYGLPRDLAPSRKIIILAEAFALLLAQQPHGRQYYFDLAATHESAADKLYRELKDKLFD